MRMRPDSDAAAINVVGERDSDSLLIDAFNRVLARDKADRALRMVGMSGEADTLHVTMNHAAEAGAWMG